MQPQLIVDLPVPGASSPGKTVGLCIIRLAVLWVNTTGLAGLLDLLVRLLCSPGPAIAIKPTVMIVIAV